MEEQTKTDTEQKPWLFKPGESGNPNGRPKDTPEVKLIRKAAKEIITEYKQALAEALPLIQPVLIARALQGDIPAIKEVHDRVMDKAKQATDITSNGQSILVQAINYDNNATPQVPTEKVPAETTESTG